MKNEQDINLKDIDYCEKEIDSYISKFKKIYSYDGNSRYKSYDHCRQTFLDNRKDPCKHDLIALNLYAYLASWGMLRHSFLMQKDYLFNRGVVDILCDDKYDSLLDYDPFIAGEKDDELIIELADEIKHYYSEKTYYTEGINEKKSIKSVSDTLITKIILGTFACTVAYDTYVKKGLAKHRMRQSFSKRSLYEIREYAKENMNSINEELCGLGELYNAIKIIDMCLFEKGFE